jgi:hypothetical protein
MAHGAGLFVCLFVCLFACVVAQLHVGRRRRRPARHRQRGQRAHVRASRAPRRRACKALNRTPSRMRRSARQIACSLVRALCACVCAALARPVLVDKWYADARADAKLGALGSCKQATLRLHPSLLLSCPLCNTQTHTHTHTHARAHPHAHHHQPFLCQLCRLLPPHPLLLARTRPAPPLSFQRSAATRAQCTHSPKPLQVCCGERHTLALLNDGTVVACGFNMHHQCGVAGGHTEVSCPADCRGGDGR